jgi:hypothetical protein
MKHVIALAMIIGASILSMDAALARGQLVPLADTALKGPAHRTAEILHVM